MKRSKSIWKVISVVVIASMLATMLPPGAFGNPSQVLAMGPRTTLGRTAADLRSFPAVNSDELADLRAEAQRLLDTDASDDTAAYTNADTVVLSALFVKASQDTKYVRQLLQTLAAVYGYDVMLSPDLKDRTAFNGWLQGFQSHLAADTDLDSIGHALLDMLDVQIGYLDALASIYGENIATSTLPAPEISISLGLTPDVDPGLKIDEWESKTGDLMWKAIEESLKRDTTKVEIYVGIPDASQTSGYRSHHKVWSKKSGSEAIGCIQNALSVIDAVNRGIELYDKYPSISHKMESKDGTGKALYTIELVADYGRSFVSGTVAFATLAAMSYRKLLEMSDAVATTPGNMVTFAQTPSGYKVSTATVKNVDDSAAATAQVAGGARGAKLARFLKLTKAIGKALNVIALVWEGAKLTQFVIEDFANTEGDIGDKLWGVVGDYRFWSKTLMWVGGLVSAAGLPIVGIPIMFVGLAIDIIGTTYYYFQALEDINQMQADMAGTLTALIEYRDLLSMEVGAYTTTIEMANQAQASYDSLHQMFQVNTTADSATIQSIKESPFAKRLAAYLGNNSAYQSAIADQARAAEIATSAAISAIDSAIAKALRWVGPKCGTEDDSLKTVEVTARLWGMQTVPVTVTLQDGTKYDFHAIPYLGTGTIQRQIWWDQQESKLQFFHALTTTFTIDDQGRLNLPYDPNLYYAWPISDENEADDVDAVQDERGGLWPYYQPNTYVDRTGLDDLVQAAISIADDGSYEVDYFLIKESTTLYNHDDFLVADVYTYGDFLEGSETVEIDQQTGQPVRTYVDKFVIDYYTTIDGPFDVGSWEYSTCWLTEFEGAVNFAIENIQVALEQADELRRLKACDEGYYPIPLPEEVVETNDNCKYDYEWGSWEYMGSTGNTALELETSVQLGQSFTAALLGSILRGHVDSEWYRRGPWSFKVENHPDGCDEMDIGRRIPFADRVYVFWSCEAWLDEVGRAETTGPIGKVTATFADGFEMTFDIIVHDPTQDTLPDDVNIRRHVPYTKDDWWGDGGLPDPSPLETHAEPALQWTPPDHQERADVFIIHIPEEHQGALNNLTFEATADRYILVHGVIGHSLGSDWFAFEDKTDTEPDGLPDEWEMAFLDNNLTTSDGTGDYDGDGYTDLTEYDAGTYPTIATPSISVSPADHHFGDLNIAESGLQTFHITNNGDAAYALGTPTITGPDSNDFTIPEDSSGCSSSEALAASASCSVEVRFSPTSAGVKEAYLSIPSQHSGVPAVKVPLGGNADVVVLTVDVAPTIREGAVVRKPGMVHSDIDPDNGPVVEFLKGEEIIPLASLTQEQQQEIRSIYNEAGIRCPTHCSKTYDTDPAEDCLVASRDRGWVFKEWTFPDWDSFSTENPYCVELDSSTEIIANFAVQTFPITATVVGEHGVISPIGEVAVEWDQDQVFVMTPDAGYHVESLTVDGNAVPPATAYVFEGVREEHTISATFAIDTANITSNANEVTVYEGSLSEDEWYDVYEIEVPEGQVWMEVRLEPIPADANFDLYLGQEPVVDLYTDFDCVSSHGGDGESEVCEVNNPSGTYYVAVERESDSSGDYTLTVNHTPPLLESGVTQGAITDDDAEHDLYQIQVPGGTGLGVWMVGTRDNQYDGRLDISVRKGQIPAHDESDCGPNGLLSWSRSRCGQSIGDTVDEGICRLFNSDPEPATYYVMVEQDYGTGSYTLTVDLPTLIPVESGSHPGSFASGELFDMYQIQLSEELWGSLRTQLWLAAQLDVVSQDAEFVLWTRAGGAPVGNHNYDDFWNQGDVIHGPDLGEFYMMVERCSGTGPYTLTIITSPVVTATAGTGGSISPSGPTVLPHQQDCKFTISPNAGYQIADVQVDGVPVGPVPEYTFPATETTDHTIEASFELKTYTITATAGDGGSILPSGEVAVIHGMSQTFEIEPDAGYQIEKVEVDGDSKGAVTTYTFSEVTGTHRIDAIFELVPTSTPTPRPEPVPITEPGDYEGSLSAGEQYDLYRLQVPEKAIGLKVMLKVPGPGKAGDFGALLDLYVWKGKQPIPPRDYDCVSQNVGDQDEICKISKPRPGETYYVMVRRVQGSGDYVLTVEFVTPESTVTPTHTPTATPTATPTRTPTPLPPQSESEPNDSRNSADEWLFGGPMQGKWDEQGDKDYFEWTAPQSGLYTVHLSDVPANVAPDLYLYKASGSSITSNTSAEAGESISLTIDANAEETFYVQVKPSSSSQTSDQLYTLKVTTVSDQDEPNDSRSQATAWDFAAPIQGYCWERVSGPGDYYVFTVPESLGSVLLTVELSEVPDNVAPDLYLYKASGSSITSNTSAEAGESVSLTIDANAEETFYVQVKPSSSSQTSDQLYTLSVTTAAQ